MKIFFTSVKKIAEVGLNATHKNSFNKSKEEVWWCFNPAVCHLLENAFPDGNRTDHYGRYLNKNIIMYTKN